MRLICEINLQLTRWNFSHGIYVGKFKRYTHSTVYSAHHIYAHLITATFSILPWCCVCFRASLPRLFVFGGFRCTARGFPSSLWHLQLEGYPDPSKGDDPFAEDFSNGLVQPPPRLTWRVSAIFAIFLRKSMEKYL